MTESGDAVLEVVRLRRLDPSLLDSLVAYGRSALGESALDEWMLPVITEHGRLYVGMLDGEIVGAAEIIRCFDEGGLYLEGFYIRPEYQSQGHGLELLGGVIRILASEGFDRMLATVAPGNKSVRGFYRRAGFIETGREQNHYGPGRDRIMLAAGLRNNINE
ncbi:MAG: GNAT family N-acetyltransferase [Actinobacteria bacterium]|nr:GNAT family N-acetyltransferase [Actinomycetota bacterium]